MNYLTVYCYIICKEIKACHRNYEISFESPIRVIHLLLYELSVIFITVNNDIGSRLNRSIISGFKFLLKTT